MIKSVKDYPTEDEDRSVKPHHALVIEPIGFNEDHPSHMPMTQPTATFASQRQKDTMPFRSRNSRKSIINMVL